MQHSTQSQAWFYTSQD